jgi:hypothetical protein
MRPCRSIGSLGLVAKRRLNRFRDLAKKSLVLRRPDSDRIVSYICIECLSSWHNFCRSYFLSCVLRPKTISGQIISVNPKVRTFSDAIDISMMTCKRSLWERGSWGRRDEPLWRNPEIFVKSCEAIGCSNIDKIKSTFSIPTKVLDHLLVFRNYYSHRNDDTIKKVRDLAFYYSISIPFKPSHPTDILLLPAYGRPQALLLDWLDDIEIYVDLLM